MEFNLEKSTATDAVLKVKLAAEDYQAGFNNKVKDYCKQASIKGFRPGKVPAGIIKKMYGESILVEEINRLLGPAVQNYIKENKLSIIGEPLPKGTDTAYEWKEGNEFEFSFELGLVSDFSLNLETTVEGLSVKVSDEDVEQSIEDLKQQLGERTTPEEAGEEDMIFGDLKIEGEEQPVKVMIEIKDLATKTGKAIFTGLKKDEVKTFDIRKAYRSNEKLAKFLNRSEEEVKEIQGEVELTVISINSNAVAEMNQEFFDKVVGPDTVSNEEEFRAKVKELLEGNYEQGAAVELNGAIRNKLVSETEIEFSPEFFKKWLLTNNKELEAEKVDAEFDKYVDELKWMLIMDRIAEENEVVVEQEEIREAAAASIRNQFAMYGMPTDQLDENIDAFVQNYLTGENGQKNYLDTYQQARTGKVFEVIKEKVTVETKEVTAEEYKKKIG
ncbi:trigger factor [Fulvitalea axinellae]|uniref:Trigger factor n=1 Tax=Fulvitalea axinellae TaxID=1182444 RepID=A0AAU9C925_9BACT|nr:trigger factor [Fulvitalea axinellae]